LKTKEFQTIPGVGDKIAQAFIDLGFTKVSDLKNKNPETIYEKLCEIRGKHIDRCVLYVFRSSVYFASNNKHNPELLKWWNWKDDGLVKSLQTDDTVKSSRCKARVLSSSHFSGAILRNEAYLSYVTMTKDEAQRRSFLRSRQVFCVQIKSEVTEFGGKGQ